MKQEKISIELFNKHIVNGTYEVLENHSSTSATVIRFLKNGECETLRVEIIVKP